MTGLSGGLFLVYEGKSLTGFSVFMTSIAALIAGAIWRKEQNYDSAKSE